MLEFFRWWSSLENPFQSFAVFVAFMFAMLFSYWFSVELVRAFRRHQ